VIVPTAAWLVQRYETKAGATAGDDPVHAPTARRGPSLVPLFVLAFIGFIAVRTAGDTLYGVSAPLWQALINTGYTASDLFLTCGMTAVGLSVSFTDMWRIGWRPLAAGFVVATLVGSCSLLLTCGLARFLT
jgi:uncharacterized membrane protein YadS